MKFTLNIRKESKIVQTVEVSEFPFTIGRAPNNSLVIEDQHISRTHITLDIDGDKVLISKNSRSGKLLIDGKNTTKKTLELPLSFEIPPYSLSLKPTEEEQEVRYEETEHVIEPMDEDSFPVVLDEEKSEEETKITSHKIKAKLILLKGLSPHESYDLVGKELILGRDSSSDIFLDDEKISRSHSRIFLQDEHFYIEDLGSTNGTLINQEKIDTPTALTSSDQIQIGDCLLQFAIFDEDIFALSARTQDSQFSNDATNAESMPPSWESEVPSYQMGRPRKKQSSQRRILFSMFGLVLLGLAYLQLNTPTEPSRSTATTDEAPKIESKKAHSELDQLTKVDRGYVEAKMKEAKSAYKNRRYKQAQISLQEALKIAPDYQAPRNMLTIINQTLQQQDRVEQIRQTQFEEQKLNEEIKLHLTVAFDYFNEQKWEKAIDEYDKILELNPGHEVALEKRQVAESKINVQPEIEPEVEEKANRNTEAEAILAEGSRLAQQGKMLAALETWRDVLKMEGIDPKYYSKSEQFITFTKKQLSEKYFPLISQVKGLLDSKEHLQAKDILEQILKEYPSHPAARKLLDKVLYALHGTAKKKYTEAIIDENVGRIESATEKFKWIVKRVPASDEYHQKSKRKLEKYE